MSETRYVSLLPSGLNRSPADTITAYIPDYANVRNVPLYNQRNGKMIIPTPNLDCWIGTIAHEGPIEDPRITQLISQIQSEAARAAVMTWATSDANNEQTAHALAARTVTDAIMTGHSSDALTIYKLLIMTGYRATALRIGVVFDSELRTGQTRKRTPLYILSTNYAARIGYMGMTLDQYLYRIHNVLYTHANIILDDNGTITALDPVYATERGRIWDNFSIVVDQPERIKTDEELYKIASSAINQIQSEAYVRTLHTDALSRLIRIRIDRGDIDPDSLYNAMTREQPISLDDPISPQRNTSTTTTTPKGNQETQTHPTNPTK